MTINTWFRDAEERQEHIDMIKDPRKWEYDDVLFLKHPARLADHRSITRDSDKPCVGYIRAGSETIVRDDDGNTETFYSVEAMVDAGWVVD